MSGMKDLSFKRQCRNYPSNYWNIKRMDDSERKTNTKQNMQQIREEETVCIARLPRVQLNILEIAERDLYLRSYHQLDHTANRSGELSVMTRVLSIYSQLLGYPYLYGYEYDCVPTYSNYGKGDIVMTDGNSRFLVIECKYLRFGTNATGARTKQKKKVKEQSLFYGEEVLSHFQLYRIPFTSVETSAVVNKDQNDTSGAVNELVRSRVTLQRKTQKITIRKSPPLHPLPVLSTN